MAVVLQYPQLEESPLPEREYYVAPRRARRRRRRVPLLSVLLALLLFGGGFLLGKASAAPAPDNPAAESGTPAASLTLDGSASGGIAAPVQSLAAAPEGSDDGAGSPVTSLTPDNSASGSGVSAPVQNTAAGQSGGEADWNLLLVNWENPLPEDFTIPALTQLKNGHAIDSRAYPALQEMMDAARAEGLQPLICSSYRTWDTQARLFNNKTQFYLDQDCRQEDAEEAAAAWVARPGTSEHQMGLAVDIVDTSYQLLDEGQENTPVQQWLMALCAEYGFILRYPTEKSALTGVNYEPWHYRYVGTEAAQEIMSRGICLEEYLDG